MATEIIRPNADISSGYGYQKVGAATLWECTLADLDSKYVLREYPPFLDVYVFFLMHFGDLTKNFSYISKITLHSIVRGSNPLVVFKYRVRTYENNYTTEELDGTMTGIDVAYNYLTNPHTGNPWTVSEVNALGAGIGIIDTGVPSGKWCDYYYIVVEGNLGKPTKNLANDLCQQKFI